MIFSYLAFGGCSLFTLAFAIGHHTYPFNLTYLFTAHINLGAATTPITISGGVRVPEPILNGTVSGPAFNATIEPGLALPTVMNNQTVQYPTIEVYGMTSDGAPFYIHEIGVGRPSAQITRIVSLSLQRWKMLTRIETIEVGGGKKYVQLRDGFILASVNPSMDRTLVTVEGYLVEKIAVAG